MRNKKLELAMFLSNRELRAFEALYQGLKEFPGFRMENIFNFQTREHFALREQAARILQRDFGHRSSKLAVALHESGHMIVMAAIYEKVTEAAIYPQGKGFAGFVATSGCTGAQDYEPLEISALPHKSIIYTDILIDSAGFVAEELFSKSSSSAYHEKFLTFVQSRYLDEINNSERLHHWNHFVNWCASILKRNEILFHEVTAELLENNSLSLTGNENLHQRIVKEPATLFF